MEADSNMAMTGPGLASAIKIAVEAVSNYPDAGESPIFTNDAALQAFCEALVTYLQTNMQLDPGTFNISSTPVTGLGGPAV